MDRTSGQPQVKLSLLLSNSFKVGPLAGHSTIVFSLRTTLYSNLISSSSSNFTVVETIRRVL
jgi:hypothetical protein